MAEVFAKPAAKEDKTITFTIPKELLPYIEECREDRLPGSTMENFVLKTLKDEALRHCLQQMIAKTKKDHADSEQAEITKISNDYTAEASRL